MNSCGGPEPLDGITLLGGIGVHGGRYSGLFVAYFIRITR